MPGASSQQQNQSYSSTYQQQQQIQRPSSSTGNNQPVVHHHYGTSNPANKAPVIVRTLDKQNGAGSQVRIMKNTVSVAIF